MNITVFSTNLSFFEPIAKALKEEGHEVINAYSNGMDAFQAGSNMMNAFMTSDLVFIEFCQEPMRKVLEYASMEKFKKVAVVARMHRIEMYNSLTSDIKLDWGLIDCLLVSANHVLNRFMYKRKGLSKPKGVAIAPTNFVDTESLNYAERRWEAPFRICMLGNFVPKKRQYSMIQNMYDLKQKFGDKFKLDIVGSRAQWGGYGNPEYYDNCLDLIEDLGLKDTVTIYDKIPHNELKHLLAREHIIVSNSNEEGTHVAIAEGIVTGCLAFCNYWRGVSEVYPAPSVSKHFKTGSQFVELCKELVECTPEQLKIRSKETAKNGIKKFAINNRYEKLVEHLELIVKEKKKI